MAAKIIDSYENPVTQLKAVMEDDKLTLLAM